MKKLLLLPISLIFSLTALFGQFTYNVLHYSETSGYDHQTRNNSFNMFSSFSMLNVTQDYDGSEFDNLSNLLNYNLIIFSNTSGDQLLDSAQQSHFEQYIQNGGNLLGIHAATDTYRHSSANGTSGIWDFYAETLGGSVQQNPHHVAGTPAFEIHKVGQHPTTDSLPNPWLKNEEYYYWENGYLDSNIQIVLKVEETVGPNNQVNSYDSSRAVSWFKILNSGSRIFYTSMGHANSNYTTDTLFQNHIQTAVYWCVGFLTSLNTYTKSHGIDLYPNPAQNYITVSSDGTQKIRLIQLLDIKGNVMEQLSTPSFPYTFELHQLPPGLYLIYFETEKSKLKLKFIKSK